MYRQKIKPQSANVINTNIVSQLQSVCQHAQKCRYTQNGKYALCNGFVQFFLCATPNESILFFFIIITAKYIYLKKTIRLLKIELNAWCDDFQMKFPLGLNSIKSIECTAAGIKRHKK